jgi:hypothetical protein
MFELSKRDAGRRAVKMAGVMALTILVCGILALRVTAAPAPQSGPALTTVSDTV